MTLTRKVKRRARDYRTLNTIPASFSVAFILASLYQFGGLSKVTVNWLDWTLSTAAVMPISVVVMMIALASSETDDFGDYTAPEKGMIGAMVVMVFGWQLTPPSFWANNIPVIGQFIADTLLSIGSPLAGMVSFVVSIIGWTVLVN